MITLQRYIYSALAGDASLGSLVGTRVYPDEAPQNTAKPYLVWDEVSGAAVHDLDGFATSSSLENHRIDVTSWGKDQTNSRDVDAAVRAAMAAATDFKAILLDTRSLGFDMVTKQFGMQSEFSVWLKT